MRKANIHEAKTHLSRLVEEAAKGKPFVIAKAGKPMVKVVPIEPAEEQPPRPRIGFMKGEIVVPSDEEWAAMDKEIAEQFEASRLFPDGS